MTSRFDNTTLGSDDSRESAILSVSSLNRLARSLLEDCFPMVNVEGEISNLAQPASGHWYLTLKDDQAQIRCAMFRNNNLKVRFRPAHGMQVIVRGRLSLYEARGDYQLILDSMQEAGAGALQKAFEVLKQKLAAEGLFAAGNKQALPEHCRHIAVITSPTGAVIRDIISVFNRRWPAMQITILPVPVQGTDAPDAIVKALSTADKRATDLGFDAVVVARGGGSLEDLQAFNDERVARAIAAMQLPVVSAVGHETDVSIADFTADVRAPTPTAAAELLSPDLHMMLRQLSTSVTKLQRQAELTLDRQSQRLSLAVTALQRQIKTIVSTQHQRLQWLRPRLQHPGRRLQDQAQTLDKLEQRLTHAASRFIEYRGHSLQMLTRNLDNISPLQTLQRGYSITQLPDGTVVTDTSQVHDGQTLINRLANGSVTSTVTAVQTKSMPVPSRRSDSST